MFQEKPWGPFGDSDDVDIQSTSTVFQGHYELVSHTLRYKKFSGDWSQWIEREQISIRKSVAVILYDPKKDKVVMVEQFRVGLLRQKGEAPWLLEVVAGFVEEDEELEQAAIREAKEETNIAIKHLISAYQFYTSPGGLSEQTSIFCGIVEAPDVGGTHGMIEEHEDIKVHVLNFADIHSLIEGGMKTSSSTLVAWLWLKMNRAHLQSLGYL